MIFVGDVSLAEGSSVSFINFPTHLLDETTNWCINLEGPVATTHYEDGFYNHRDALDRFLNQFKRVSHAFVANNHIHDIPAGLDATLAYLNKKRVGVVGVDDRNLHNLSAIQNGSEFVFILGFGWDIIGCRERGIGSVSSINLLNWDRVLSIAGRAVEEANGKVYVCFHASYELDPLPQPLHRELSRRLVELGVSGIIFHHSHVVGPVEIYRNALIVYGLGNWCASRGRFLYGQHVYPSICNRQIAVDFSSAGSPVIHQFTTQNGMDILYEKSTAIADSELLAKFSGFSDREYLTWYKSNYKNKFLLPFFSSSDSDLMFLGKRFMIKIRSFAIFLLVVLGIKSRTPRGR